MEEIRLSDFCLVVVGLENRVSSLGKTASVDQFAVRGPGSRTVTDVRADSSRFRGFPAYVQRPESEESALGIRKPSPLPWPES